MVDNGAVNYSLSVNGNYNIPQGYHNGQGKVTQSIAIMNGSTVNPSTSTVTIATDKKYVNGNFIIPGFSLPNANVIKKGVTVTIYGRSVTGTFEGWVPSPTDWYYNGVIASGFSVDTTNWRKENTRLYLLRVLNSYPFTILTNNNSLNLRSYSKLTLSGYFVPLGDDAYADLIVAGSGRFLSASFSNDRYSVEIDISQATQGTITLKFYNLKLNSYITRIRVS